MTLTPPYRVGMQLANGSRIYGTVTGADPSGDLTVILDPLLELRAGVYRAPLESMVEIATLHDLGMPHSVTCPSCARTSWNPNDVLEGWCGACHEQTQGRWPFRMTRPSGDTTAPPNAP